MTPGSHRLLGFAFASADLLIEIDADGRIAFALGASEALSGAGEAQLAGRDWRTFVDRSDHSMVQALFDGLEGRRGGPVLLRLAAVANGAPRAATLTACKLPLNDGAISCAFTRAVWPADLVGGLHDRSSFEGAAARLYETARASGVELELAFVELTGLARLQAKMPPDRAQDARERLTGVLRAQSHGGGAAADLGADRFALVRQRALEPAAAFAQRLVRLLDIDDQAIDATAATMEFAGDSSPAQVLRALRFSLDSFIRDGVAEVSGLTLGEAVTQSMRRTLVSASALSRAVNEGGFRLVYQPVVDLKAQGKLHHHEVLVRFGDDASPFPLIRMAEELDIIEPLDLAVLDRATERLVLDRSLTLAVNISGRTIGSSEFVEAVRNMLAARPAARGRLLLELTESAAIEDLAQADRRLQALRAEGCQICLDDFGAGAASLAYLQQLQLDLVKIDGRYIRDLQHGGRESAFIRHLVTMCTELGVKTLAEMVETPQVEEAVRRAGVDYAQGWLYGPGVDQPGPPLTAAVEAQPTRRRGSVESWA